MEQADWTAKKNEKNIHKLDKPLWREADRTAKETTLH